MKTLRLAIAAFSILAAATVVSAQSTAFDIEFGYQNVDVSGNENMFMTQINQDSGFVLRNLSVSYFDPSENPGFADRLRLDASGFGGNPAGRLHLQMGRDHTYRLNLFYQQFKTFSALPAFANPLLDDGVMPGQHTWDRTRDILDIRLELPLWAAITPVVGYRWNRYDGPGLTTYHVGGDEFQISSDLEQTESEFYLGFDFATKAVQGTLTQGWRDFDGTNNQGLAPGAGAGNNPGSLLGQDVELDSFSRTEKTSVSTPVTTFHITARASDRIRLIGSYVYADADGDTNMSEMLAGSLVSFQLASFFRGLDQSVESNTSSPFQRGEARAEFDLGDHVDLKVGYEFRDRELDGWAMISSLFMETMSFSGYEQGDIVSLVEAQTGYTRKDQIGNLRVDVRDIGLFRFWGQFVVDDQDLDVSQDVAEIVLPYGQEGQFNRKVDSYEVGGMVDLGSAKILLDLGGQSADDIIMRTDFNDRSYIRGRVDWSIGRLFRVLATAESIDTDNQSSGVGYDATTTHYALDFTVTPVDNFNLGLAWDNYSTDSQSPYRVPQTLDPAMSIYTEDGDMYSGNLRWTISIVTLSAAYSTFENTGSFPLKMDHATARVAVDLTKNIAVAGEYENWDYSENLFSAADYNADRWGLYLRYRR